MQEKLEVAHCQLFFTTTLHDLSRPATNPIARPLVAGIHNIPKAESRPTRVFLYSYLSLVPFMKLYNSAFLSSDNSRYSTFTYIVKY
jgi:hypothetical protein